MTEVMEPRVPKSPVTPSPKYYCFLWGSQGSHHFTFYIVPIIQTLLFRYHCYCSVGDDLMSILRNAIQCKICGDVIESTSIHDFKTCSCGACSVDGGHDYLRRCAKSLDDFVDLSEFQKQDVEEKLDWGSCMREKPLKPYLRNTTVSATLLPPLSIPLQNFLRLERRKTGKIAPKSYSCQRDSVSCTVADRRRYTAQKAAASSVR